MNLFSKNLSFNKENILYNIPDGVDCFAVFELLKYFNNTLVILRDDVRLERFSKSLKIIDNEINIIRWDIINLVKDNEKCKNISLDEITNRLYKSLNSHFYSYKITEVLLENQPVLKNPVMKSIQMIIFSFFQYQKILLNREINLIKLINASNKLKIGKTFTEINNNEDILKIKTKYMRNKKLAILYTYKVLDEKIDNSENYIKFFNDSKKKDDLSDAILQAIYHIKVY